LRVANPLLMSIITTRKVSEAEAVAVSAETRTTSTTGSTTPTRRASPLSRMRRIITTTTLQEDTKTPPEEISVEVEEASRRTAKVSAVVAEAEVADPGLLKNIKIQVR